MPAFDPQHGRRSARTGRHPGHRLLRRSHPRAAPGPCDIALVEGSVTTPHEIERIKEVRAQAKTVIALGTCATAGGVQALRNFANAEEYASVVLRPSEYLHYLQTATPIAEHIVVDLELWGCPVNKAQVLEVIIALLSNRRPNLPPYSVCLECKRRGTTCVIVDKGIPCIGPATQAGCGAICPAMGRGCYGCFGPARDVNAGSMAAMLLKMERYPGRPPAYSAASADTPQSSVPSLTTSWP
ncbi:MAG: hypothetical protein MZV64_62705 [Ignavibacteriales bacterium]|nr:hypothetical protein [Ignavibacteriales bacterium]